jgi:DNA processing protein
LAEGVGEGAVLGIVNPEGRNGELSALLIRFYGMASKELASTDPAYPAALASLGSPTLYVRGELPTERGVAIVGTRDASTEALAFTRRLAAELAAEGIVVWSGGARGVDRAAHEGALDANGTTVVVAGGGLDCPYPPEHVPLFDRVLAAKGALLSRVPDSTRPLAMHFLRRNEILAALTALTVVVEAGARSGARSTAAAARRLGRPLAVVPQVPWDPRGLGCALELAAGATAVTSTADVLAVLRGEPPPRPPPRERRRTKKRSARKNETPEQAVLGGAPWAASDPIERVIVAALEAEQKALHLDELAEATGLACQVILGALLTLTLGAVVVEGPAGFFRRVRRF